jgi:thiamine biosynthesis lipoprotein
VSVVAPLCVVAGSCATVAMLLEEAGEAFLREQGFRYLAVARDGSVHGGSRGRLTGAARPAGP